MMKDSYKVLIRSCWALLLVCFTIKVLGGNIFEVACENESFIKLCNWLDRHWFKYIITSLIYIIPCYLPYLCMVNKKIGQDLWIILLILPCSPLKVFFPIIGMVLDTVILILIPLLLCKFKNWKRVIFNCIITLSFQLISLITKNIGYYMENNSLLISIILSIDYYIMIILYYLYCRKEIR